jgi:hypothetical protein
MILRGWSASIFGRDVNRHGYSGSRSCCFVKNRVGSCFSSDNLMMDLIDHGFSGTTFLHSSYSVFEGRVVDMVLGVFYSKNWVGHRSVGVYLFGQRLYLD